MKKELLGIRINEFNRAVLNFDKKFSEIFLKLDDSIKSKTREIRIRINKSPQIYMGYNSLFLSSSGNVYNKSIDAGNWINRDIIQNLIKSLSLYSLHTHHNEIINGFISTSNGCRVGISGNAIYENNKIKSIRDITSISLRISREFYNCGKDFLNIILNGQGGLLIVGPPASGKTTILRDLCRMLASGAYGNIVLLDERMEIASVNLGEPFYDVGDCCDILSSYRKKDGIEHAIRTLSPQYIICDEIGNEEDIISLEKLVNSGVNMISTLHAYDFDDFLIKKGCRELLNTKAFKNIVFLKSSRNEIGKIDSIYKLEDIERIIKND